MAVGINGGREAWILSASKWQFLQRVTASSRRARRNRLHMNVHDRARGGTREEHPEGRKSTARAAGCEQSTPRPPEPQATTRIEQLNTQEMVAYKPADSCIVA